MSLDKMLKALEVGSPISAMHKKIEEWEGWYRGNIKSFHNYQVFNGKRTINRTRASLNMAKTVAESFADLLLNEKVEFTYDGENADLIEQVLEDNDFRVEGNRLVELSFALGSGAFVLSLDEVVLTESGQAEVDGAKVDIKYYKASDMFPIKVDGDVVKKLAVRTAKSVVVGDEVKEYTLFTVIEKFDNAVIYENRLFNEDGREVGSEEFAELFPDIVQLIMLPLSFDPFIIIKPNIVNSYDTNSPYGASVYSGATDILREIDVAFDSLINEFNLGKKRIFIDENALSFDSSGNPKFDDRDMVFYALGGLTGDGENKVGESIKESDFKLRIQEHRDGLKIGLDTLSRKVGLGGDYFNYDNKGAVTATEVVSRNSELYRSISKHSILLRSELESLIQSINSLLNGVNNTKHDIKVVIDFDDSVIEDEGAIEQRALLEFNSGVIDLHEYIKITRGFDDEMASKFVEEMEKRKKVKEETAEVNEDGSEYNE